MTFNGDRECEGCEQMRFDVEKVKVHGQIHRLCPDCSMEVAFGGKSPEDIGPSATETLPDPELPDVPKTLVDELPKARRDDYRAVVLKGKRPSDRAIEREVSTAAVSQNVTSAREQLRSLSQEAT